MSKVSYTLMNGMPSELNFTSEKVRAAGWYGSTKGLHTISIAVHNLQGRVYIEGSQLVDPKTDDDWYSVPYPAPFTGQLYIEYPRVGCCAPNLIPSQYGYAYVNQLYSQRNPNWKGETSTYGFSFRTNCLWLRARICRQYLIPIGLAAYERSLRDNIGSLGAVDNILINY